MNEVTKLYENAGLEPNYDYFTLFDDKVHKIGRTMHLCKKELKHWLENYQKDYVAIKVIRVDKGYPPFTAEKQIELIKWLIQNDISDERIIRSNFEKTYYYCLFTWKYPFHESEAFTKFEEALAYIFNYIWQRLTEEERKQIKNILELEVSLC